MVIAILGILSTVISVAALSARDKAKGAAVASLMRSLAYHAELLVDREGRYPINLCKPPVPPNPPVHFHGREDYGQFDSGPLWREAEEVRKYVAHEGWSLWNVFCTVDTFTEKPSAWAGFAMVKPSSIYFDQVYFCVDSSGFGGSNYIAGPGGKCVPFP